MTTPITKTIAGLAVIAAAATIRVAPARPQLALATGTWSHLAARATPTPAYGSYSWPVHGPVLRPFDEPAGPYGSGHRGIDIGAPFGTRVRAAQDGVVAFAGRVAGALFVSIDHPDGVRTTYSWLSDATVHTGERVHAGDPIGRSGYGHPDVPEPHLHFGARIGTTYIDPMLLLEGRGVAGLIHLAPIADDGDAEVSP